MYASMCILCVHVFWGHGHLYVCACIYMSLDHVGRVCVQVCLWVMVVVYVSIHAYMCVYVSMCVFGPWCLYVWMHVHIHAHIVDLMMTTGLEWLLF